MKSYKIFGTIFGVLAFIALVVGITYAWLFWTSGNTIIGGSTECFTINYVNGQNISGQITPSSTYTGGKTTTVQIGIDSSCNIGGSATIKLTTDNSSTINLSEGAVKYAVYNSDTLVSEGAITGETQALATVDLTKVATTYTVYVWIDGEIADNDYVGKTYSGYIHVSATQVEK